MLSGVVPVQWFLQMFVSFCFVLIDSLVGLYSKQILHVDAHFVP